MHFFEKKHLLVGVRSFIAVLVFALVATIALVVVEGGKAQASTPFGGMVTDVFYCNCSNNWRITVSPPVGGVFMYEPGVTVVYEYHMIPVTGVWLLGLHGAPVSCLIFSLKGCAAMGPYPMIEMTGTSR
jgi:hypothetical protein